VVGSAGSGKSTIAAALLGRLSELDYTFCVVAPEGGYDTLAGAVTLGTAERPPSVDEILKLFSKPDRSGVVNLTGLGAHDRAAFFDSLLPRLTQLRVSRGNPHWLVIDDAGASLRSKSKERASSETMQPSVLQITIHPSRIAASALAAVDLLIASGESPQKAIAEFCQITELPAPHMDPITLLPGEALAWRPRTRGSAPFRLRFASDPPS
jgi:hypothetical protein